MISYIKINKCTPNVLYNNSIAMKLLAGKVGEFWWETRLWLKLIVGHCRYYLSIRVISALTRLN